MRKREGKLENKPITSIQVQLHPLVSISFIQKLTLPKMYNANKHGRNAIKSFFRYE